MDKGPWRATVHRVTKEKEKTEQPNNSEAGSGPDQTGARNVRETTLGSRWIL